jgi:hypothetical protein
MLQTLLLTDAQGMHTVTIPQPTLVERQQGSVIKLQERKSRNIPSSYSKYAYKKIKLKHPPQVNPNLSSIH